MSKISKKPIINNIQDIEMLNVNTSYQIVQHVLNDVIDIVIKKADHRHNEQFIETRILHFKKLIYRNLQDTEISTEPIKKYEVSRYITICVLLKTFTTKLFSHTIETSVRDRIKNMYYNIYKTSVYHKELRKFNALLRLNQIPLKKYMSVKTISLLDNMGHYMQRQMQFIDKLLKQRGLFQIISKETLDDFICKLIFISTLIIRFSS